VRQVPEKEIFPNRDAQNGQVVVIPVFNVSFYPDERGPYNFDTNPANIDPATGKFTNPQNRWGGIMRRIETTDFDVANVEFIQFWMMDPFNSNTLNTNQAGGDLYFNLGNVSEDVLKDGRLEYENGLPADGDTSRATRGVWGFTPKTQPPIIYAFDNNPDARQFQDVGFDGVRNSIEPSLHSRCIRMKQPILRVMITITTAEQITTMPVWVSSNVIKNSATPKVTHQRMHNRRKPIQQQQPRFPMWRT
jgi:cell surface protein SprA